MKSTFQYLVWSGALVATLVALSTGTGQAHDEQPHANPSGSVVKEQKPWGIAGDSRAVKRTIRFSMTDDMRFSPERIEVAEGETVRFVLVNKGKQTHEFVLGTREELDQHAALMQKFPNMEHDEPYMAHVAPGSRGTVVWTFNRAGEFDFACLIAGHYEAGMAGKVTVRKT